jgi:hypothetical protein
MAARQAEPGSTTAWARHMLGGPRTRVIEPGPLTEAGARRVVVNTFREAEAAADPDVASECYAATLGNPLFLRELLKELVAEAHRRGRLAASDVSGLAPRAVGELMATRLDRMPPGARALADAVAVLDEPAPLPRAAAVAGLGGEDAAQAADALSHAMILAPGRPLRFVHPIVRSVIYARRAPGDVGADHVRAARLLVAEGSAPETVAVHLLAAEPRGDPWVVDQLRAAATAALGKGAPRAAERYLSRALHEGVGGPARVDLLLELGAAEARAGSPAASEHLSAAIEQAPNAQMRVRATVELGQSLAYGGHAGEAARTVRRTLDELGEAGPALRRPLDMILLFLSQTTVDGRELAQDLLDTAVAVTDRLEEDAPRGLLAIVALERALVNGTAAEAAELGQRALADGRLVSEQTPEAPHTFIATAALAAADQYDLAERHLP